MGNKISVVFLAHPNRLVLWLVLARAASLAVSAVASKEASSSNSWGTKSKIMGANQSKEEGQGMLGQMKHILSPKKPSLATNKPVPVQRESSQSSICSTNSLPPTPKSLSDTLASPRLRKEFLSFLQELDSQAGVPENHCGRAESLQFVVAVRELLNAGEKCDRQIVVYEDWEVYFPRDRVGGLVLPDTGLWRECAGVVQRGEVDREGRESLQLARDHCVRELTRMHPQFVAQRVTQTPMTRLVSCALL